MKNNVWTTVLIIVIGVGLAMGGYWILSQTTKTKETDPNKTKGEKEPAETDPTVESSGSGGGSKSAGITKGVKGNFKGIRCYEEPDPVEPVKELPPAPIEEYKPIIAPEKVCNCPEQNYMQNYPQESYAMYGTRKLKLA